MAQRDFSNHEKQIEQAQEAEDFLKSKFTSTERYGQMVQEISAIYFQSYQMAYNLAKRAERCFQQELGVEHTNFIQFGYWDSLKKGLLAGERLAKDLRRMEMAYLEQNRREYEITQHFSLAILNPTALLELQENGRCEFDIPELAFDIAYPGQYMRRIKSVSLTIPCVAGPYSNVSAKLTLLKNRLRISSNGQQEYAYEGLEDPKFRHDPVGITSIATSSGKNDSGLFQLNFQDERYLPFEGAGAICTWKLELPSQFQPFDYTTISDAVLHMSYTARDGGDRLREKANQNVAGAINTWLDELAEQGVGLQRVLSLGREFPDVMHKLLFSEAGSNESVKLNIDKRNFPYFLRNRELTTKKVAIVLRPTAGKTIAAPDLSVDINQTPISGFSVKAKNFLMSEDMDFAQDITDTPEPWNFSVSEGSLDPESIQDISLLVTYEVGSSIN